MINVKSGAFTIGAFSLAEVLIVIVVIGLIAGLVVPRVGNLEDHVRVQKLSADVESLNRAINVYRSNGGQLNDCDSPTEILNRLKSVRSDAASHTFVGLTGSTVDHRLAARMMADEDSSGHLAPGPPAF